jgi:fluoride exporter
VLRVFLIGLAGLMGTLCRYWLSGVLARRYGETFPAGTLVVNVLGCLLIGFLFYMFQERYVVGQTARTVVLIGFLGGFTTFSSYGLQTFTLLRDGEFAYAAVNVVASNVLGLAMVWVGYMLARVMGGL